MVKVRFEGTSAEVAELLLKFQKEYNVLSVSREYANRGKSQYVRVYADVQGATSPAPLLERLRAMLEECKERESEIDAQRNELTCGELCGEKGRELLVQRDEVVSAIDALYASIYYLERNVKSATA